MRQTLLLFSLLLFVSNARACLNDRDSDSLAIQAKKLPDTLRVITGRFERNPPLYYQMRIRRSLAELEKSPKQFSFYDDISVAYDRIHRDDAALYTMEQKKALLPVFNPKIPAVKEAWYRYYANAGTFHVHYWLGAGANVKTIAELNTARQFIKRAIQIKPNAHFGRERYQLMVMDWILAVKTKETDWTLGEWLERREHWEHDPWETTSRRASAVEGLSGLIVLGAAWQSTDVYEALANALYSSQGGSLRYLALLRTRELQKEGHTSLNPRAIHVDSDLGMSSRPDIERAGINVQNQKSLNALYPQLRHNADEWAKQRTDYMMTRLEKGRHPDTDNTFWNEWKPLPAPSLDVFWFNEKEARLALERRNDLITLLSLTLLTATLASAMWSRFRSRKAKRQLNGNSHDERQSHDTQ